MADPRDPVDRRDPAGGAADLGGADGEAALLGALRTVWTEHDPVPDGLVARLQATAALAAADTDLDVELMTLVDRSAELTGARGARRSAGSAYTLRFAHAGIDLLVRVEPGGSGAGAASASDGGRGGSGARVDCWLVPPSPVVVRVLLGDVPGDHPGRVVEVGDTGRFEITDLPSGLLRLRLEPVDGSPAFVTPAFEI